MSDNFIRFYKNQFPDDLCDKLINLLENNIKKGKSHSGVVGKNAINPTQKDSIDLDLIPESGIAGLDINIFNFIMKFIY